MRLIADSNLRSQLVIHEVAVTSAAWRIHAEESAGLVDIDSRLKTAN